MVVAILALVMATTGTGLAGVAAISSLTKKDKKQVAKIARAQVNKMAPGMSVARSKTADTSTSATNATEATNATNATNATHADLAGNVTNQFWAMVRADGTLQKGSPGVSSEPAGAVGRYFVTFPQPTTDCFYMASITSETFVFFGTPPEGEITTEPPLVSSSADVRVDTFNIAGSASPLPFTLLVRC
jgi:hypothetical protein